MKTIEDLRPEARSLDPEWSAGTIRMILSEPPGGHAAKLGVVDKRRRRVRLVVAVASAAAVLSAVGFIVPFGSKSLPAAAAQLTAEHLSIHPEVGASEFLHIKKVQRLWGYGGLGVESPFTLEYWVPGDGQSEWIERSGTPGELETHAFDDWGPKLYVDHSRDPAALVRELRDYAASNGEGRAVHGLWTVAFWIANDPVAPQSFKDEVMRALVTVGRVRVVDPDFRAGDLRGEALTIDGQHEVWFVVAPSTRAFRGIVGHPEKDQTWVGPEAPMWTITIESGVTSEAPNAD